MKRKDTFIQADSMGMGKTAQAIEYMKQTTDCHFIVVCPSSLKSNWCRELNDWLGIIVKPDIYTGDIIVTNYEKVGRMIDMIGDYVYNFKGVIFDEAHMIKNVYAGRTYEAKRLVDKVGNPMMLTGTPILNRPNDLLGLLYVGGKLSEFGGIDAYTRRYIPNVEKDNAIFYCNFAHLDELHEKIEPFVCRRRWCDIRRPTFPIKKTEVTLGSFANAPLSSVNITNIQKVENEVMNRKLPLVVRWIQRDYDTHHEPLVVFANHRQMIDVLSAVFPNSTVVYGGMTYKEKEQNVQKFLNGDADIILCSLACAACGLNLVRSHRVVFAEFPWTKGIYEQAIARCARRGQTKTTEVFALIMENSYDRYRLEQMRWKSAIADDIIDGKDKKDGRYYLGNLPHSVLACLEDGSIDTSPYFGMDIYSDEFTIAIAEMSRDWLLANTQVKGNEDIYWECVFCCFTQYVFGTAISMLSQGLSYDMSNLSNMNLLSDMSGYGVKTLQARYTWFLNRCKQLGFDQTWIFLVRFNP